MVHTERLQCSSFLGSILYFLIKQKTGHYSKGTTLEPLPRELPISLLDARCKNMILQLCSEYGNTQLVIIEAATVALNQAETDPPIGRTVLNGPHWGAYPLSLGSFGV